MFANMFAKKQANQQEQEASTNRRASTKTRKKRAKQSNGRQGQSQQQILETKRQKIQARLDALEVCEISDGASISL
jgi:hypothetical protein